MRIFLGFIGLVLLLTVLLDAFESIILPRRVTHEFRLGRNFLRSLWKLWTPLSRRIRSRKNRETYLSYFGPLALLLLFALWAVLLMVAFALLQWGAGSARGGAPTFRTDLYLSGSTLFTVGMGDVVPLTAAARFLAVVEAGIGLGFLAVVISYLPTTYAAFSQREMNISLLDARAGSPPTAGELLRRNGRRHMSGGLEQYLRGWETWSAQLMESHLTYPILCFFRSQHNNQSWLAALTSILDICALIIAYGEGEAKRQAELTFITARHAVADVAEVLSVVRWPPKPERLPPEDMTVLRGLILECGARNCTAEGDAKLHELRGLYEPIVNGLSRLLLMTLPPWGATPPEVSRATTIWTRVTSEGQPIAGAAGAAAPESVTREGSLSDNPADDDSHF